jgi:Fe-S-cluster containining protein
LVPFDCNHNGDCDKVRLCCMDTEMTITKADAKRIANLGYRREDYLVRTTDGFCQLRNINHYCFFYDSERKLCRIYESRPDGCRFYPIVYDMRKRKCITDKDCPSRKTMTRDEIRKLCHKVKALVNQLRREVMYHERPC